jgi:hypothetical protein
MKIEEIIAIESQNAGELHMVYFHDPAPSIIRSRNGSNDA